MPYPLFVGFEKQYTSFKMLSGGHQMSRELLIFKCSLMKEFMRLQARPLAVIFICPIIQRKKALLLNAVRQWRSALKDTYVVKLLTSINAESEFLIKLTVSKSTDRVK